MKIDANINEQLTNQAQQEVASKERDVFLYGFIGHNRTGKTSVAVDLASEWKSSREGDDAFIVSHDPQNKFKDNADFFILPADKNWAEKCLDLRNSLIILDDYRILHPSNLMSPGFSNLMSYRAEYSLDIIYICHNPALILTNLTYYTTHYFIFYTQARLGAFEKKISNYMICHGACTYVNKYVKVFGKGKHRLDPKFEGQDFPYVVVNNQTEDMTAINFKEEYINSNV